MIILPDASLELDFEIAAVLIVAVAVMGLLLFALL
jgi:hypothetical protein